MDPHPHPALLAERNERLWLDGVPGQGLKPDRARKLRQDGLSFHQGKMVPDADTRPAPKGYEGIAWQMLPHLWAKTIWIEAHRTMSAKMTPIPLVAIRAPRPMHGRGRCACPAASGWGALPSLIQHRPNEKRPCCSPRKRRRVQPRGLPVRRSTSLAAQGSRLALAATGHCQSDDRAPTPRFV